MTKYILITGCISDSVGYFLAQEFVSKDYHVFATARKILNMGDLTSNPDHIPTLALDIISLGLILAVRHRQIQVQWESRHDIPQFRLSICRGH
jgi:short-subunit dehydrogenase